MTATMVTLALREFQSTPPSGERSDPGTACHWCIQDVFQSTPPSGERSDTSRVGLCCPGDCFNPRPPPERGATLCEIALRSKQEVSIHAPLRREERQTVEAKRQPRRSFNPRPPPERGATNRENMRASMD